MSAVTVGATEPEPDPKRRRLLDAGDAGGPVEDDETARQKMRDAKVYERGVDGTPGDYAGFDPDNARDVKSKSPYEDADDQNAITPMGYFAYEGDLPMMRWLYVNGADTRDVDVPILFPMWAAVTSMRMDLCKWLFDHGAAKDIKRKTRENRLGRDYGRSALYFTFESALPYYHNLSRWLILNGALCKDGDSGELDVEIMKRDLGIDNPWLVRERKLLLEWANDLQRPRTSFLLFLSGALSPPMHASSTSRTASPLQLLGGKPGILELIGDYVGHFVRGREARIIRQLTEMLPDLID